MMSGLMMFFLLISVTYNIQVAEQSEKLESTNKKIQEITGYYTDNRHQIYEALNEKFSHKFLEWGASLDRETLTLTFKNPAILFEPGSDELTARFREILSEMWPGYISVLKRYSDDISEVRIEGHTSSEWSDVTLDESYFNNMQLSQQRTHAALEYCYSLTPEQEKKWVRESVTANGLSFSRPKLSDEGVEDPMMSRRVEFTVIVNSSKTLENIKEVLDE